MVSAGLRLFWIAAAVSCSPSRVISSARIASERSINRPEFAIWSIRNNIGAGKRIRTLGRNCSSS